MSTTLILTVVGLSAGFVYEYQRSVWESETRRELDSKDQSNRTKFKKDFSSNRAEEIFAEESYRKVVNSKNFEAAKTTEQDKPSPNPNPNTNPTH
ncbi:U17-like protein [Lissonota sp. PSUC_FEM 10030012]|nr:U17-like protein [Lissonota sp. PSUC_FEM 10030012]